VYDIKVLLKRYGALLTNWLPVLITSTSVNLDITPHLHSRQGAIKMLWLHCSGCVRLIWWTSTASRALLLLKQVWTSFR